MELSLVAGRECGSCNVCCVAFTVDEPELQKLPGYHCHNCQPDGGCAIYEARPQTCRAFHCGWRRLKWVGAGLRPDLSGVVIRLTSGETAAGGQQLGVLFTVLTDAGLEADGLAEAVGAAVHANIPTSLHVPGPPGFTASRVRLNDVLREAVGRRDKAAILRTLTELRAEGQAGPHSPIILASQQNTPNG